MKKFEQIYLIVKSIPKGKVLRYGDIAKTVGGISPKIVGFALSSLKDEDVPWHRVVNARGEISERKNSNGDLVQRELLISEGIFFEKLKKIDLSKYLYRIDNG